MFWTFTEIKVHIYSATPPILMKLYNVLDGEESWYLLLQSRSLVVLDRVILLIVDSQFKFVLECIVNTWLWIMSDKVVWLTDPNVLLLMFGICVNGNIVAAVILIKSQTIYFANELRLRCECFLYCSYRWMQHLYPCKLGDLL